MKYIVTVEVDEEDEKISEMLESVSGDNWKLLVQAHCNAVGDFMERMLNRHSDENGGCWFGDAYSFKTLNVKLIEK